MAHYVCKCGKHTYGRFAKAQMTWHVISKHIPAQRENELYSDFRKRCEEWMECALE